MKSHSLHSSPCFLVPLAAPPRRRGFTLMELMVSVAILVVIILSVGVTFKGAASSVGVSNATIEMTADVRAIQNQIERDVSGIDRNGYIAIRVCINNPSVSPVNPSIPFPRFVDLSYHFDQISFISTGMFNNRTGADTITPFTDSSTASAAHIWIGQGVMETVNPPTGDTTYFSSDQNIATPPGQFPTGAFPGFPNAIKESEMTLLRHQTLLMPGPVNALGHIPGTFVMAYSGLEATGVSIVGQQEAGFPANISSSRYAAVAQTPAQVYQSIFRDTGNGVGQAPFPEVDLFTYRFRALSSVYDTAVGGPNVRYGPFVNGYFRTTPIMMKGVSSFKIEWTDGKVYPSTDSRFGQLKWYGPTQLSGGFPYPGFDPAIYGFDGNAPGFPLEQFNANGIVHNGVNLNDQYIAIFNYSNRTSWPKALRFTMHIASDRLTGGRDFVQVVNVPQ